MRYLTYLGYPYGLVTTDSSNSEVLSETCSEVDVEGMTLAEFEWLSLLMSEMNRIMRSKGGCGMAAPQMGVPLSIFTIFYYSYTAGYHVSSVFMNPTFIPNPLDLSTKSGMEGCLSIPGKSYGVERFSSIHMSAYDFVRSEYVEELWSGYSAIIFQHELDHLDGILILDSGI